MRVLTLSGESTTFVGNDFLPNMLVDIQFSDSSGTDNHESELFGITILTNVRVFAVNDVADVESPNNKRQQGLVSWGKSISLLVTPAQAQKLSEAAGKDGIRFIVPKVNGAKTAQPTAMPIDATPPSEKSQTGLPPYRIESPDLLQIELLKPSSGTNSVTGRYLVDPDGIIKLPNCGSVFIGGKTVAEGRAALEKHLAKYVKSPQVSLDVIAYNSKVYYVINYGPTLGDSVRHFPVTGNETALDVISQVSELSPVQHKEIWISRPDANEPTKWKHLPVDWNAITQGAQTTTNYQVLPFDRIFIEDLREGSTRQGNARDASDNQRHKYAAKT